MDSLLYDQSRLCVKCNVSCDYDPHFRKVVQAISKRDEAEDGCTEVSEQNADLTDGKGAAYHHGRRLK